MSQALPAEKPEAVLAAVWEVTTQPREGLLSLGLLLTIWAASTGVFGIMKNPNYTYQVKESRNFLKIRAMAVELTIALAVLILGVFMFIIFGGLLQQWILQVFGPSQVILMTFVALRWSIIFSMLLLSFALVYARLLLRRRPRAGLQVYHAGSAIGVAMLVLASLAFRFYVTNFGDYSKTYGSIGAVIVLMTWLYLFGLVLLIGSEINALIEHHSSKGKNPAKGSRARELTITRGPLVPVKNTQVTVAARPLFSPDVEGLNLSKKRL